MQFDGGDGPVISGPGCRPYFFLSYARTPKRDPADRSDPDRWVHKLYKDLCDEILQMTDAQPGEAGFMDRENKLGAEWSPELMAALKACRVFVPLYSRRYFESDNCGKEWFAFAQREVMHQAQDGEAVSAVVPALWTRLDRAKIPEVARNFQYEHADLGERYRSEGFYGIMKLRNYRSDYQRAVHRLAERIIEVGDQSIARADADVQGMERKDFESLPSAFGPASARRTASDQLQITVLAHDTSTLPEGRLSDYYGETPHTWSPYQPAYSRPLADYAQELARKCLDYEPLLGAFEDGLLPWPGTGRMPPSLYLVDVWVSLSDSYLERLSLLNQISDPWVSVLIPWNNQDAGLSALEKDLRERLREHLDRRLDSVPRRCRMAADGIPTLQDFILLLPDMAMIMLKRYRKYAPAHPPKGPAITRPRLRRADAEDLGGAR
ncbi:MAG: TIR-like protein FxsC [Streptosporangiaceae bacterium]